MAHQGRVIILLVHGLCMYVIYYFVSFYVIICLWISIERGGGSEVSQPAPHSRTCCHGDRLRSMELVSGQHGSRRAQRQARRLRGRSARVGGTQTSARAKRAAGCAVARQPRRFHGALEADTRTHFVLYQFSLNIDMCVCVCVCVCVCACFFLRLRLKHTHTHTHTHTHRTLLRRPLHRLCDGHANTLVLIFNDQGHVFGGFSGSAPWQSTGG